MARFSARVGLVELALVAGAALVIGRAVELQIVEGAKWRAEADRTRRQEVVLEARRGGIYDRRGTPLAVTQEYFAVGIAPNELRFPGQDARRIAGALGLPAERVRRDVGSRRWIAYQGPFNGLQVSALRGMRGVYLDGHLARHYPAGRLARAVVGTLSPDSGRGISGIELILDAALAGTPGSAVVLRDQLGRRYVSPGRQDREPVPGDDVYLTIDAELQEIAEVALEEAMERYEAAAGDVVMLDPGTGEVLAAASRQRLDGQPVSGRATFFTDPFEPGSTAKLFTAGALLELGRVDSTDEVDGENGVWNMAVNSRGDTRPIHDTHRTPGRLTLARAIQISSNIAMGKFSQRLSATEQFEALRAFGFGSPSGVEFPSETRGAIRLPHQWDTYSKASIAMGYEFAVTPVQLAAAYAAIGNDGILLTPALVREVRSPGGELRYQHRPEPVRRAVSPGTAASLRGLLRGAVAAGGTGEGAQLTGFQLAGKTGTTRRFEGGRYVDRSYIASFASLFPAEHPQLAVVVKIDDPRGSRVFGGQTAAPLTRGMLEEALATRRSALDRQRLPGGVIEARVPEDRIGAAEAPAGGDSALALPVAPLRAPVERRVVPPVAGGSLRHAVSLLHRRGFRVSVRGTGSPRRTTPASGDSARAGTTVILWAE